VGPWGIARRGAFVATSGMVTGDRKILAPRRFHKVWRGTVLDIVNGLKDLAACYALCRELG
jgi:hypothetical protein